MEFNVFEHFKGFERTSEAPRTPEDRESVLQKDYERIWLPPPVKHSPWDEGT